jgi:hypothetical protein
MHKLKGLKIQQNQDSLVKVATLFYLNKKVLLTNKIIFHQITETRK